MIPRGASKRIFTTEAQRHRETPYGIENSHRGEADALRATRSKSKPEGTEVAEATELRHASGRGDARLPGSSASEGLQKAQFPAKALSRQEPREMRYHRRPNRPRRPGKRPSTSGAGHLCFLRDLQIIPPSISSLCLCVSVVKLSFSASQRLCGELASRSVPIAR